MKIERLKSGDEIRIIAPSRSMTILSKETIDIAVSRLTKLGLRVTFGKNVLKSMQYYDCSSIGERIEDLHDAFKDKNVKAILTVVGGYNSNQLLEKIDYNLIRNNPKIFCGLSDITAIQNAIYAKTGLITFSGVHFSTFGMKYGFEYSLEYFEEIFFRCKNKIILLPSETYSNDEWYLNQEKRIFLKNEGITVLNEGKAEGVLIGGNLCTLNLLQGTEYNPEFKNCILFLEDTANLNEQYLQDFDRNFVSLIQCIGIENVRGIIVGRAEDQSEMTIEKWELLFKIKNFNKNIPIIINANFGHTTPSFIFPIGGTCKIDTEKDIIQVGLKEIF